MITQIAGAELRQGQSARGPGMPTRVAVAASPLGLRVEDALLRLPSKLVGVAGSPHPLLSSVDETDRATGRALRLLGALIHDTADERRTAEYLLRNRDRLSTLGVDRLVAAARCAAEMDVRRGRTFEIATDPSHFGASTDWTGRARQNDPSIGESVVTYVRDFYDRRLPALVEHALLDATVVFMELARRHGINAGTTPSMLAMRPTVRPEARLVTHLRRAGFGPIVSRRLARLLIGGDGTSIRTGLLWWVANSDRDDEPGELVRSRWLRDIDAVIKALTWLSAEHAP